MDHDELEGMLRGESPSEGVETDIDLEIESEPELSRGSFTLGRQELSYVGHLGEMDLDGMTPRQALEVLQRWQERHGGSAR